MRRVSKRVYAIVLILVLALSMMTGCKAKPQPEEAQAYVQAVLDLMCTGDYDHSVELADVEEGKEAAVRDGLIDDMMSQISAESNLNEEVSSSFKEFMIAALAKAKYTVGEATAADDGGYDVTVSIEPLQIFAGVGDDINKTLEERISTDANEIMTMTEEEQTNYVMAVLIELLNKNLEDPKYDPAEEVTVHYGPVEGESGAYGCTEAEGEKLGSKLFSDKGL